jgi:hypothetical protein
MTAGNYFAMFMALTLYQVPLLVISAWGLVLSVSRKNYLGRVSTSAIWGFSLLIAYSLFSVLLRILLTGIQTNQRLQGGPALAESMARLNLWSLSAYPIFIVGVALLARAVFLDRAHGPSANRSLREPKPAST